MRNLIILRGAPACGKSKFIIENGLEPWTISSDNIRMIISGPELNPNGEFSIPQDINMKTFSYLHSFLEERMKRGELVIVDATHSRINELGIYNKLCKEYRYRKFYVQFETPLAECLSNDKKRPSYKRVPEKSIRKVFERIAKNPMPDGWTRIPQDKFWETIDFKTWDFSEYEAVEIIGDIHGCMAPLEEHFKKYPFNEKTKYIFVGDFLDRGIQNKQVLEFILSLYEKENVTLLEGNHERWLRYFANGSDEEIRSSEFVNNTFYQICDCDRSNVRQMCRKLNQIALFDFCGEKYLVTHGGLCSFPEHIISVSCEQLIKGVGGYKTDVDLLYKDSRASAIQVHGHRNISDDNDGNEMSYNLEGKVEIGGFLKVLRLENGTKTVLKYKNPVFKQISDTDFRNSNLIQEKILGNGLSSFNFTRDAFFDKKWNELTCKARGLFMNTEDHSVVARGYEKFFNIGETFQTKIEKLSEKLTGEIIAYKKENGFLGILSYYDNDLLFCSKSSTSSDFAQYFRDLFNSSGINREEVVDYLKDGKHSLVFEVIDTVNDPHIIKENTSKIVLLDSISNQIDFERISYENLVILAKRFGCPVKQVYAKFNDFSSFKQWYTNLNSANFDDIEGVVIESGDFMVKLKFDYYNFWKQMRSIVESLRKHGKVKHVPDSEEGIKFFNWIKDAPELWDKDIITLRDLYKKGS